MKASMELIRFSRWWYHVVPPVLAFGYLWCWNNGVRFESSLSILAAIFLFSIGASAFGYITNDIFDISIDKKAGKTNRVAHLSMVQKTGLVVASVLIIFSALLLVRISFLSIVLLSLQILLLTSYSVPPTRLKRFSKIAILIDSLYSGCIFYIFTYSLFCDNFNDSPNYLIVLSIFAWGLSKGIRNIINHQLDERKKDKKTGIVTFANLYKPLKIITFLNGILVPVEILLSVFLFLSIGNSGYPILVLQLFFFLLYLFNFRLWKIFLLNQRHFTNKFRMFLNDFYEDWLPNGLLLLLILCDWHYIVLFFIHSMLFSRSILKFGNIIIKLPYDVVSLFKDSALIAGNLIKKNSKS